MVCGNRGCCAACFRYDALDLELKGVYNIVNRSKCIASKFIDLYG